MPAERSGRRRSQRIAMSENTLTRMSRGRYLFQYFMPKRKICMMSLFCRRPTHHGRFKKFSPHSITFRVRLQAFYKRNFYFNLPWNKRRFLSKIVSSCFRMIFCDLSWFLQSGWLYWQCRTIQSIYITKRFKRHFVPLILFVVELYDSNGGADAACLRLKARFIILRRKRKCRSQDTLFRVSFARFFVFCLDFLLKSWYNDVVTRSE